MNKKGIITLSVLGAGVAFEGGRRLFRHFKKKAKEDKSRNKKLEKTCEAFRKECLKNELSGIEALYLMDQLKEEIDKMGMDPNTINVKEDIPQGAGA